MKTLPGYTGYAGPFPGSEFRWRTTLRTRTMKMNKPPNATDRHAGRRVRMRRMMLGMSQERLGDALGIRFQQVQKYEKGTNRMSAGRLQQIAASLQVPVALFFEGQPDGLQPI